MSNDKVEKILDIKVQYNEAIKGIAEYNVKVKELKDEETLLTARWKEGKIESQEYYEKIAALKAESAQYTEGVRVLSKEIQNNIKAEKEQEGSLVSLRASLSNLTRQYDEMGEAERNSASGQDLEIHINAITDKIKKAEESTQRFYRNVGSYQEAFENALSPLKDKLDELTTAYLKMSDEERKGAKGEEMRKHIQEIKNKLEDTSAAGGKFQNELLRLTGVQSGFLGSIAGSVNGINNMSQAFIAGKAAVAAFAKQLMALLKNPIVAILAAIALAVMTLKKAISSSEESMNRWSKAMAPISRALNFMLGILQKIGSWLLGGIELASSFFAKLAKIAESIPGIGNKIKEMNEASGEAVALAEEKAAFEKQAREDEVQNAKAALEVSKLRTLAKDKEKYTAEERLKFVRQANKLEEEQSKRNVELAERKLKALQIESSWADNNAETNKELAKLEADVYRARKEYFDKTRELKEQENTIIQESTAKAKAEAEAKKKAAKEAADKVKEAKQKELEAVRQAEDAILSLLKDGVEKQRKEITISYTRQIEDLQRKLKEEKNLTKKAREEINKTIVLLQQKQEQELQKLSDEEIKTLIEQEQKRIALKLATVKKGSEEELTLRLQQLENQKELELENTKLTEEDRLLIIAKYQKQEQDLKNQHNEELRRQSANAIKADFEERITEAYGNEQQILSIQLEQRKAELDALHQMEGESDADFKLRQLDAKQAYLDAQKSLNDKEIEIEQAKASALAEIGDSIVSVLDSVSEGNKQAAIAAKMIGLATVAINQGIAISDAVRLAMKSGSWIDAIAKITTGIATVVANMATAIKSIKSAKFATGGYVSGPGTGTSDSIPAQLSNGESVIAARPTEMFAPLLSSLNMMGGGVPINVTATSSQTLGEDMLARAVAKGVRMMPNPVVAVSEINQVNNRVDVLENLSKL